MHQAPVAVAVARPDGARAAPGHRPAPEMTPLAASPGRDPGRNPGIDALRGLSILFVILQHAAIRLPVEHGALATLLPGWLVAGLFEHGYESVFVFFVISGFLIASHSLRRWGALGAIDVRAFYRRRAARILPCLAILVAVLAVLDRTGAAGYAIDAPGQSLAGAALAALGLQVNLYEARHGLLPPSWSVLWSLSIEEVFYLGFPIAGLLLARTRLLVPALVVLALALPSLRAAIHGDEVWREKAYLPGMAAIATGVVAACLVARWPSARRTTVLLTGVLGAVGLAASLFFDQSVWHLLHGNAMLLLTLSAAALVVAAHWRATAVEARRGRAFAWLRSFGRLSYEIYLTHMFVVIAVAAAFAAAGAPVASSAWWIVPVLAGAWALGGSVARFVSAPAERWMIAAWPSRPGAQAGQAAAEVST